MDENRNSVSKFYNFVRRWRVAILLIFPVLAYIGSQGQSGLGFSSDYRVYFSEDNEQLKSFEAMQDTYTKSDNLVIVISPKVGELFSRENLSAIEWITEQAWLTPYSIRVDSITNFQRVSADEDTITVNNLISDAINLPDDTISNSKQFALSEPQLIGRVLSENGRVTAINVTYQLPEISPYETAEVVTYARLLNEKIAEKYPGLDVYLTGMAMYNHAFYEAAMADSSKTTPIMYLVIILTCILVLRSIIATIHAVIIVFLSVGAALGIAGWLGMSLTALSGSAPLVILIICIADCIHILAGILRHMRDGNDKESAIKCTMRESTRPVVITSLVNASGFIALNFSDVPPFRDLGNIVALGIGCALIFSIFFLPAMVSLFPLKVRPSSDIFSILSVKLGKWVTSHVNAVLWVLVPLSILFVAFATKNELNDQYVKWFHTDMAFRKANDFTMEHLTGLYSIEYSLSSNVANEHEDKVSSPSFLKQADLFVQWLRDQPEVKHVSSITDTMKRVNQSIEGGQSSSYHLPVDADTAAQSMLLYEMSLPYGLDLNNQVNVSKRATRLIVTLGDLTTSEIIHFEKKSMSWLNEHSPNVKGITASTTLMFAHIGERNINGIIFSMLLTAFLISLFLIVAFRSFKFGLLSLIPNILPIAITFGIWGLFVGQLGFSVAIVATVTLGIIVDDTVHYITAILDGLREEKLGIEAAIHNASRTTGGALLATTLILVVGFLVLGTSSFALNSQMGIMTAITLVTAIVMDLIFIPALIIKFMERKYAK